MSVNIKTVSIPQIRHFAGDNQVSEPQGFAQCSRLGELPGLIFGLMTLVYVVSSLWLLG
ncbi:MAG TPA: hypothetical protein VGI36_18090 [Candidatus Binataceae bacterium]|jgi:hypothetical protein